MRAFVAPLAADAAPTPRRPRAAPSAAAPLRSDAAPHRTRRIRRADMTSPLGLGLVLALALAQLWAGPPPALAHTYHVGRCPRLPPVNDFVTSRFLGRWHVLQKTSTRVRCLRNEYSRAEGAGRGGRGGEWAEEQAEPDAPLALLQSMQLPLPAVNNHVRYAGTLRPADRPGAFTARFPLNMLGSASYVVFDTDYDTFAGVYSCQQLALWYRQSASIMSRDRKLSADTIRKLQRQLTAHGIDVDDLDEIKQTCGSDMDDQGIQVHIKPNVFRSNATALLEDANEAVKGAADAAKRALDVYNTVQTVYAGASAAAGGKRRRRRRAARAPRRGHLEKQLRLDWMP